MQLLGALSMPKARTSTFIMRHRVQVYFPWMMLRPSMRPGLDRGTRSIPGAPRPKAQAAEMDGEVGGEVLDRGVLWPGFRGKSPSPGRAGIPCPALTGAPRALLISAGPSGERT